MKTLAIILMWVTAMLNHQFKRVLMVPHFDCSGEEVIVEGEYVKEWMIRNRVLNCGFELGDDKNPSEQLYWSKYGTSSPTVKILLYGSSQRSGSHCGYYNGAHIVSDPIPISPSAFQFGVRATIWTRKAIESTSTVRSISIQFGTIVDGLFVDGETIDGAHVLMDAADWNVYKKLTVCVLPTDTTIRTHTHVRILCQQSNSAPSLWDDATLCYYNPHHIVDFDAFSALNVEDLETFTFGQNYNYESGGQPLADASRLSEDTVQYLRMANSRAERVKIRDPIDIYRMRFMLYSKAQQTQLMHWYKRTRGLPFIWVDECGIERDVQWVQAPDIMPRSNNPEIATVQIVLETIDAGEV